MRKRIVIILMAAVMITGCGNAPHNSAELQSTAEEAGIDAKAEDPQVSEESEAVLKPETTPGSKSGKEKEVKSGSESGKEQEVSPEAEVVLEEEMPVHTCSLDGDSTVIVLAFGEHEPNCFYGAKYDVKCKDCGECLDVVYQGPLGHTGNEGVVTCQPDCSGEGSVRYTCIRCGAEWSEAYGQVQPHVWVEGIRKETDWINGGTKEVSYLYCSVCGIREESQ